MVGGVVSVGLWWSGLLTSALPCVGATGRHLARPPRRQHTYGPTPFLGALSAAGVRWARAAGTPWGRAHHSRTCEYNPVVSGRRGISV